MNDLFKKCYYRGGFIVLLVPLLLMCSNVSIAQQQWKSQHNFADSVQEAWVARYNGPGNYEDNAKDIAIDDSGNIYITGNSLGSSTAMDYATIKYNPAGEMLWVARYNGIGNWNDAALAIAIDASGNVYVTGGSVNLDFDYDYATVKYNSSGEEMWVARYNGLGTLTDYKDDIARDIAVDGSGNVYVTGSSYGPGTTEDCVTIKYNSSGEEEWVHRYNGPGNSIDVGMAITTDGDGNIYVTGNAVPEGTSTADYLTIKYNALGDTIWIKLYNGVGGRADAATAIVIDGSGNVYVTGYSDRRNSSIARFDLTTIKYSSLGTEEWVTRYNGPGNLSNYGRGIVLDEIGNIYVTGESMGSGTGMDYATIKFSPSGDTLWVARYNGPGNDADYAKAIAIDGSGNVYVTGAGPGTFWDYITVKYNSSGEEMWVASYNGSENSSDESNAIAVDNSGNVYVTGASIGSGSYLDYATVKYVQVPSSSTFQLTVNIEDEWNIVSIPGLHPVNQGVDTWWTGRNPSTFVFGYDEGYYSVTEVEPGLGYWMEHIGNQEYNTGDEWPSGGINIVSNESIGGNEGWNLIGGYHYNAPVSGITTTPTGLQTGLVWGYSSTVGYQAADDLIPGYGYWIELTGAGDINLPDATFKGSGKFSVRIKEDWGRIIITDNAGKSYTLYGVNGNVDLNQFNLPPLPPSEKFDIRYGSGRIAEDLSAGTQIVEMKGISYPVTVKVENMTARIQDASGEIVNTELSSGEQVTINNSSVDKLMVLGGELTLPIVYSLDQNYPNPFNPSTTIKFSLPEATNVSLTVFNVLGQKVSELVNTKLDAGRYSYQWDASNLASGIYLYQLMTDKFNSIKKMMLIK